MEFAKIMWVVIPNPVGWQFLLGNGTCPVRNSCRIRLRQPRDSAAGRPRLGEDRTMWDESQVCMSSLLKVKWDCWETKELCHKAGWIQCMPLREGLRGQRKGRRALCWWAGQMWWGRGSRQGQDHSRDLPDLEPQCSQLASTLPELTSTSPPDCEQFQIWVSDNIFWW
jgi:hypothetical protein